MHGGWTAEITQTGDPFYGTYTSDVVSGNVSGYVTSDNGFTWKVTGGGGAELTGSVSGKNSVTGKFIGPTCPASAGKTYGTFFGGRQAK